MHGKKSKISCVELDNCKNFSSTCNNYKKGKGNISMNVNDSQNAEDIEQI